MTSGVQCVMMAGAALMQLQSVSSWDMHILEVSASAENVIVLVKVDLIQSTYAS